MSVRFEFYLSDDDTDRLYAIKESNEKSFFTGNEYAKELLENQLHKIHPEKVEFDENGKLIR